MAGESISVYNTTVNAVTSGASIADTVFSAAPANAVVGDHVLCDVVFSGTFASAPVAGQVLSLYRRDMNIVGTTDAPTPSSSNRNTYVGAFLLSTDATQAVNLSGVPLAPDCEFYIENESGQTLNAAWTLDVKPFGFGIA